MQINTYIESIRPKHWIKNLLVFSAPLLAFKLNTDIWLSAIGSFIAFSLMASSIYLINDCKDINIDKLHPKKKFRPIAAGKLSISNALVTAFALFVLALFLAYSLNTIFFSTLLLYGFIQIIYCLRLKKEPLLDIFCISSGFLIRSISGGIAGNLYISPWFILSVGLLALFLALEKRKAELRVFELNGFLTRDVLKKYSMPLLLRLESIVSTGSFITYSLWASGPKLQGASSSWMLLTVPLVLLGIFRYQYLSDPFILNKINNKYSQIDCENPVNVLFNDKLIRVIILSWILAIFIISNLNN